MDTVHNTAPILETLPLEIVQNILASLDDIPSLICAALTGPFLFNALHFSEESIATQVLINQLSPALVHDAITTQKSYRYRERIAPDEEVVRFIERYFDGLREPSLPPLRLTISNSLPLSQFHKKIRYLSDHLITDMLSENPVSGRPDLSPQPPLKGELVRIERALYRMEIYYNIYLNRRTHRLNDAFFSCLSPWENEQLACVRDCMFRILAPVLKQAAINDPYWQREESLDEHGRSYFMSDLLEHHLNHGLSNVHHLLSDSRPEVCLAVPTDAIGDVHRGCKLYKDLAPQQLNLRSGTRIRFGASLTLGVAGVYIYYMKHYYDLTPHASALDRWVIRKTTLAALDDADEAKLVPRPVAPDPDPGPEQVWRWAHDLDFVEHFVAGNRQQPLRKWGYVFWDKKRLDMWDVFGRNWRDLRASLV